LTIYVDPLMGYGWKFLGNKVHNCHLFSDTGIDELHAFAERIGMNRELFHDVRIPHYDLTQAPRRLAVSCGAVEVDLRQAVDLWARIQGRASALTIEDIEP
jgi:Protein of unknown function (DUF4031)